MSPVCSKKRTPLPQTTRLALPACLIHYLSDPDILKIGVGVKSVDATKLLRDYPDLPPIRGLFELSTLVKAVDRPRWEKRSIGGLISLQELTYTYLDAYLEKGNERTSNWENKGPWNPKAKQMTSKQLDCESSSCVMAFFLEHFRAMSHRCLWRCRRRSADFSAYNRGK